MTAAAALLSRLERTGLSVSVAAEGLRVRPRDLLTDELRAAVKTEREALINLLIGAHFRWSVTRPGAWAMEVRFSPEATLERVRTLYPGAYCVPLLGGE